MVPVRTFRTLNLAGKRRVRWRCRRVWETTEAGGDFNLHLSSALKLWIQWFVQSVGSEVQVGIKVKSCRAWKEVQLFLMQNWY